MTTRNIVPRGNGEGQLGTAAKHWAKLFADEIHEGANLGNNASLGYRQPNTTYAVGNIAYHSALPIGYYLECTTAGTTAAGDITPSSTVGSTVSDGMVTWKVCKDIGTGNAPIYAGFNQKQTFTSSGSFTAPVTGIYRLTLQGAGGGGSGSNSHDGANYLTGAGGGEGGHLEFYERLTAGTTYNFTIGAGGATTPLATAGNNGGTSSITLNGNAYTATGGGGGNIFTTGISAGGGKGGIGKINNVNVVGSNGMPGEAAVKAVNNYITQGGNGGGAGGGLSPYGSGVAGGGGSGGWRGDNGQQGNAGGDGYIIFEWLDTSLL